MKFVFFYHSLVSCWNHGNAHFLRGVARELLRRGHEVRVLEPADGWSRKNLARRHGPEALTRYRAAYPELTSETYERNALDLDMLLDGADVVLVHEWNDPHLIEALGRKRAETGRFRLFFHDTHHRAVSADDELDSLDLADYDAVLVFGEVLRDLYLRRGWARRVLTWHEAADTTVFRHREDADGEGSDGDLVWIGNWGDNERAQELMEFLVAPVTECGLDAMVYGVRYPHDARRQLRRAGIDYGGWLPNHEAPEVFSRYRFTMHVPRRPYARSLPGIPTIRMFEALACGIPLISAPWEDAEGLFPDDCYLKARDGADMVRQIRRLMNEPELAASLSDKGLAAIAARHSCAHRVDELFEFMEAMNSGPQITRPIEVAL